MTKGKIFPTKLSEIFEYLNLVIPYLLDVPNRGRLGLTGVTALDDADTILGGTYNPKYAAAANPTTNTKPVRTARDNAAKTIISKLRFVYGEIPESALTEDDRVLLNLKLRDTTPTARPVIDSIPVIKVMSLGAGRMRAIARTNSDDSRASIQPDSDGIEIVYLITTIDAPAPASPNFCTTKYFSSEARFEVDAGADNLGKRVYGFARWMNMTDPSKNGPFTDMFTTVLGGSGGE